MYSVGTPLEAQRKLRLERTRNELTCNLAISRMALGPEAIWCRAHGGMVDCETRKTSAMHLLSNLIASLVNDSQSVIQENTIEISNAPAEPGSKKGKCHTYPTTSIYLPGPQPPSVAKAHPSNHSNCRQRVSDPVQRQRTSNAPGTDNGGHQRSNTLASVSSNSLLSLLEGES